MNHPVAATIEELYQFVNPDMALPPEDPRYVDLSPARGSEDIVALVARRIHVQKAPYYHRQLLTGHRGSGKSTELHRLEDRLRKDGFLIAYLDVELSLDIADVEYLDLIVAMAYALDKAAHDNKLKINPQLLKDVTGWFAEVLLTEEERQEAELGLDVEAGIGAEIPLLAKVLTQVMGKIRSGSVNRREVRQKLEPQLQTLFTRLELLVDNITIQAQKQGLKGVVIIVDSLEKMPLKVLNEQGLTNHSLLFVEHAEQIKSLPCHTIYTVPVSLLNDRNLGVAYTDIDLIPMVKIATPERHPWQEGRALLHRVVEQRLDIAQLFHDPQDVYRLIEASGGVIRDLMRLLRFAADYTPLGEKIHPEAVARAIPKLVREYDRLIRAEDLPLLDRVAQNVHTPVSADLARLMYNRLVLPYINDENWVDLHPAVQAAPTFRTYIKDERQLA